MTRHDELRKEIEYQLLAIKILKLECKEKVEACNRLIASFQKEIDMDIDYAIEAD